MTKQIFQIIYLSLSLFVLLMTVTHCEQAVDFKSNGADTTYYDVVFRESKAGVYKKWQQGAGSYGYYYAYTDRGRGPILSEQITLNENHFIQTQSISGINYLKDSVYEYFEVNGNRAKWINSAGKDQGEFLSEALYFRYDGTPASYEILAQGLMNVENKSVELYPKGSVTLMQKNPIILGDSITTQLLMIKGLDMNPVYLWLTEQALIGKITGNLHIIRTDFQDYRKEMKVIQDSLENEYLFRLATDLSQEIDDLIIKNVNIFTVEATLKRNQDVWVHKDKIRAIVPNTQSMECGNDARIIDGTGKKYDGIAKQKAELESIGYDCYMIFVNTSLDIALERNAKRERTVPEDIVIRSWKAVQNNIGKFNNLFKNGMIIVDNNKADEDIILSVFRRIKTLLKNKVTNRRAHQWMDMEMKRRGITKKPKGF